MTLLNPRGIGFEAKNKILRGQEGVKMFNDINASIGIELSSFIEV